MNTKLKRLEQRRKLVEKLGGCCSKCGYNKNIAALDFHHIDPEEKVSTIGEMINHHKFSDAEKESEKCVLLCKVCHAELHNPDLEIEVSNGKVEYIDKKLKDVNKKCKICGSYSGGQMFCSDECAKTDKRKVKDRPTKEELNEMIEDMSWVAIGRKYDVSDNAVRKWAKQYELIK